MKLSDNITANVQVDETPKEIILNQAQIDEWKKQYGKIYSTTVDDIAVVWRTLRRAEYVDIMTNSSEDEPTRRIFERQEKILTTACLYPANIGVIIDEKGGFATAVSGEIMEKSGFGDILTKEL